MLSPPCRDTEGSAQHNTCSKGKVSQTVLQILNNPSEDTLEKSGNMNQILNEQINWAKNLEMPTSQRKSVISL